MSWVRIPSLTPKFPQVRGLRLAVCQVWAGRRQVRVFLVLADELHFGRVAERLGLSQPRVSRLVAALEREVGGALFERTSRRVRLTSLGTPLRDGWGPGYAQLLAALDDACAAARQPAGTVHAGFIRTAGGAALTSLVRAFETAHPGSVVRLNEVGMLDLYGPLRRGDIDVLVSWLVPGEPGLTMGPVIEHGVRVLAVGREHPLARPSPGCRWPSAAT
jgi:DNA-binding transcriptional LysR family regulator